MSGAVRMARRGLPLRRRLGAPTGRAVARRFRPSPLTRTLWVALVTGLLAGGMILVALRIDIIRLRYGLAQALERESELRGEQRELIVRDRRLRQPARLAGLAAELGFDRPAVVIHLPERAGEGAGEDASEPGSLPAVGAAPGVVP